MENYYINKVNEIAKLGAEKKVDWSVALDMYDKEHGTPDGDIAVLRAEFYEHVDGRAFDADGNEVTGD